MQLVIIAGGKGTRLGLKDIPKPMVEIDGKPLLEYQIELAKRYGVKDIFILSGHLAEVPFKYFRNGEDFGVNITHIIEPYPLGTAGCIKIMEHIIKEKFMVFYGDVVMDFDLDNFIGFDKQHSSVASILVHPNDHPYDSDLVEINACNQVTAFYSKPHKQDMYYKNLVNAAVYIFSPEIFKYIPCGESKDFGKHVFPEILAKGGSISAYPTTEYVKDIGTLDRFEKVKNDFISGKVARLNRKNKRKAVFLDRDGIINKDTDNLSRIEDFELLENVAQAIKKINKSEYLSIIATNQPMIAKGFITESELSEIHKKMETILGNDNAYIDGLYYCPHHPESGFEGEIKELKINCECRKPLSGMLIRASEEYNVDLENSWMIGDREADVIAGKNAGCRTVLLSDTSKSSDYADFCFKNLLEAVNFILEEKR